MIQTCQSVTKAAFSPPAEARMLSPGEWRRDWSFGSAVSTAGGAHVAEALPAAEGLPAGGACGGSGPRRRIRGRPRCLASVANDDGQVIDHMLPLTELDVAFLRTISAAERWS